MNNNQFNIPQADSNLLYLYLQTINKYDLERLKVLYQLELAKHPNNNDYNEINKTILQVLDEKNNS